jgi:hypothetical protein
LYDQKQHFIKQKYLQKSIEFPDRISAKDKKGLLHQLEERKLQKEAKIYATSVVGMT